MATNKNYSSAMRKTFGLVAEPAPEAAPALAEVAPPQAVVPASPAPSQTVAPVETDPAPATSSAVSFPAESDLDQAPPSTSMRSVPSIVATDLMPLTSANSGPAQATTSARPTGRPRSAVERIPKTLAVQADTDENLDQLVGAVQRWRGRGRGVPKVNQGEVVDFAVEYLRRRLFEGLEAAEAFYQQQQTREGTYIRS